MIVDADRFNRKTLGISSAGVTDTIETIAFEPVTI
jgi:hypothetical protein